MTCEMDVMALTLQIVPNHKLQGEIRGYDKCLTAITRDVTYDAYGASFTVSLLPETERKNKINARCDVATHRVEAIAHSRLIISISFRDAGRLLSLAFFTPLIYHSSRITFSGITFRRLGEIGNLAIRLLR